MHSSDPHRIYRQQQVSGLGTGPLLLLAMDTAVRACRQKRRGLLTRVIGELVAGLDLSCGEIAGNLLTLYEYLLRLVREGRLDEAQAILEDLRDTWARALAQQAAATTPPEAAESFIQIEG